ncbi:MAG: tetratricopeptide repeat protein [Desulfobacteraceae bacterium]|nr:tetratricopeptide repeat protein [Desulfobacteraceae bacterium]
MKRTFVVCGIMGILFLCFVSCSRNVKKIEYKKMNSKVEKNVHTEEEKIASIRVLGEAYLREKKYAAAYKNLKEAEKLAPKDPHVHFALGIFYYEKENFDMAIEEYQKTLKLNPEFASARNNLGIVYLAKKEWDKAIACFDELYNNYIYATPHFPMFLTGQAYFHKKDFKNAESFFKKTLSIEPEFVVAMQWLGKTYIETRQISNAIGILEKSVKLSPRVPIFYYDLGRAYVLARKYSKARSAFLETVRLDPTGPLAGVAEKEVAKYSKIKK